MTDNPFWQFTLDFYQQPGVEKACLTFQDKFGGNVCLLLFCCWLDINSCAVNIDQLATLDQQVHEWESQFLQELRLSRRQSRPQKDHAESSQQFYELLKRLELQGEKYLCDQLYTWYLQQPIAESRAPDCTRNYLRMYAVDTSLASLIIDTANNFSGTNSGRR